MNSRTDGRNVRPETLEQSTSAGPVPPRWWRVILEIAVIASAAIGAVDIR